MIFLILYTFIPHPCQVGSSLLQRDHAHVLHLEQIAADKKVSVELLADLKRVFTPPVRLMMMCFEEDLYLPSSDAGRHFLSGLLRTLPDNKLIEDLHGVLRTASKTQKTRKLTVHQMMELLTQSKQLSSRKIPHLPKVDRDVFLRSFPKTPDRKRKRLGFDWRKSVLIFLLGYMNLLICSFVICLAFIPLYAEQNLVPSHPCCHTALCTCCGQFHCIFY